MRLESIIDWFGDLIDLPLRVTESSDSKFIRVLGVLMFCFWFFPSTLLLVMAIGVLGIPAMVQDA